MWLQISFALSGNPFAGLIHRLLGAARYFGQPKGLFLAYIRLLRAVGKLSPEDYDRTAEFIRAIAESDLFLVSGGGFLTDSFPTHCLRVLKSLELAHYLGIPSAMLGQGIGPLQDAGLKKVFAQVVPGVSLIGLREGRQSKELLENVGATDGQKVFVTGDDAIEIAYHGENGSFAKGIGVNVRRASYAEISDGEIESIRKVLQRVAQKFSAKLISLPVEQSSDPEAIRNLLEGLPFMDVGREPITLDELLKHIRECRVVVTGSYHAAVFALSQGIPAVCLAKSDYYQGKFVGLAHQFGAGCQMITMESDRLEESLAEKIELAWNCSEDVRTPLLESARAQIEAGQYAYQQLLNLAPSGSQKPTPR